MIDGQQIFSGREIPSVQRYSDPEGLAFISETGDAISDVSEGAAIGDQGRMIKMVYSSQTRKPSDSQSKIYT